MQTNVCPAHVNITANVTWMAVPSLVIAQDSGTDELVTVSNKTDHNMNTPQHR